MDNTFLDIWQEDSNWQALKNGKPEALSALFHQYYAPLFQYGQKLTHYNTELTKEIIQDLFFKLWDRRTTLGDVRSVKIYLFTAFRRILIDKSRHLKVEENFTASFKPTDTYENSPEDNFLFEEKRLTDAQKLKKAILKLPNRVREAITLRYFEEMSYTEIAEIMELKERTVYNFVHEGLSLLRRGLMVFLLLIL
ncbi:MAG: sigma-70 family RNA polymerase sigma factor [Saprospiraceae bacterium]|nr:sigma-70 family RNA polymerase sigma factor [Saprospiraceae bacterium]